MTTYRLTVTRRDAPDLTPMQLDYTSLCMVCERAREWLAMGFDVAIARASKVGAL